MSLSEYINDAKPAVKTYLNGYPQKIKDRIANSAGAITCFLPLGAYLETAITGMSDPVSMKSRAYGALFTAAIVPAILDLRKKSREHFGVTEKSWKRTAHDAGLYLAVGGMYKAGAYIAAGETDLERIVIGTALTSIGSAALGTLILGTGDMFEKAWTKAGDALSKNAKTMRRYASAAMIAASITATASIYSTDWQAQQREETSQPTTYQNQRKESHSSATTLKSAMSQ